MPTKQTKTRKPRAIDPIEARSSGVEAVLAKPYRPDDPLRALARNDAAAEWAPGGTRLPASGHNQKLVTAKLTLEGITLKPVDKACGGLDRDGSAHVNVASPVLLFAGRGTQRAVR